MGVYARRHGLVGLIVAVPAVAGGAAAVIGRAREGTGGAGHTQRVEDAGFDQSFPAGIADVGGGGAGSQVLDVVVGREREVESDCIVLGNSLS